jgi:parvulin-like peptidyl-prolyl isomerase
MPSSRVDRDHPVRGWLLLVLLITISGCSRESGHKPYIARVGTAELTEDDLAASTDSLRRIPRQPREVVNEWIINELLSQEAAHRGLTTTDGFRRQMETTKKRLAIAALLDQELFADNDTVLVNDAALATAFKAAANEYVLREDVVLASYAIFSDRDAANTFRSTVLRGRNWNDALLQARVDSLTAPHLLRAAERQYFTQTTLYPQELWKLARTLARNEVSFVAKTDAGYYVLMVHGVKHQGEIPDFEYVRSDVRQRLLIEERRARYEKLVSDLRARHPVDIRLERVDTTETAKD